MLITCPECAKEVSSNAIFCPNCGNPFKISKLRQSKAKRLPNGFGQITEIKGKPLRKPFRVMVSQGVKENGRPIVKMLKPVAYFATYNEAYKALVEYNKKPWSLDNSMTMDQLFSAWLQERVVGKVGEKRLARVKYIWRLCESVHGLHVTEFHPVILRECVNGLMNTNYYATVDMINIFKKIMDYAQQYELVPVNPIQSFKLSMQAPDTNGHIAYSEYELAKLWENVGRIEGIDLILIQCYSGFRPNELLTLKTENIFLDMGYMIGGFKTKAGTNRKVPIHSKIKELICSRYDLNNEYLCLHRGKPLSYTAYLHMIANITTNLSLNPSHKAHDGRVTFVTLAKKYDMNEYAIKRIVGHEISDITEKIYTKRDIDWLIEEMKKIK